MQRINFKQGSPEWHEHRSTHFNASDAPAMMGCSNYKTRNKLIEEMATGIRDDVSPATQKIFDDGHRFERLARPLAEAFHGEELFPVVGTEGKLSASFDGLTMMQDIAWEHKTLNAELAEIMVDGFKGNDLPLMYRVQMEQQVSVSGCERILFTASKWDDDDELIDIRHCWYEPDDNLEEEILNGWEQLAQDVADYKPEEPVKSANAEHIAELPTLFIDIEGDVKSTNLASYEQAVIERIRSINTDLVTDDDFATAEATVKFLDKAEKETESVKKQALAKTASIEELFRTVDNLREEMRQKRLELNKLVQERKRELKLEVAMDAKKSIFNYIAELNYDCHGYLIEPASDFNSAMKNKRTIESLKSSADDEVARVKVEAKKQAEIIKTNLAFLDTNKEHEFLFSNEVARLVNLNTDHLSAEIKARISDYEAKEKARLEAEKERVRQAEEARIAKEKADAIANNPFMHENGSGAVDAQSRIDMVARFSLSQCHLALKLDGLQKTVEKKIRSRIGFLEKPVESEPTPAPDESEKTKQQTRPQDIEIIMAVAIAYSVSKDTAMQWISEIQFNQKEAL